MNGIDVVLSKLDTPKKSGGSWMARCPAHDDSTASLSISVGRDQPVVFTCHAGCDPDLILDALHLTWADVSADKPKPDAKAEILATYDYVDENGDLLYQVVRLTPKSFRQRRPDSKGGWTWKLDGVRRPVYRLPEVLAAVAAGDPVFVVEGEKDADAIRAAGHVATCNSGGAGKWQPEHTAALAGAHVIVVADRDLPGRRHAQHIAFAAVAVDATVTCCEPASGKDVSDHLNAGLTLDDLDVVEDCWVSALDVADDPGPLEPELDLGPEPSDGQVSMIDRIRGEVLTGAQVKTIPSRRSLVKGWLDLDSLAVLFGRAGGGKSLIAIDIALCIATGSWWQGNRTRPGDVFYVVAEGAAGIGDRQTAWEKHNKVYEAPERMHWLPMAVNLLDPVAAAALAQVAADKRPVLVVIDTLARSMPGGDENTGKDMGLIVAAADRLRRATGACVLIVHHSGKDTSAGARGWSGLLGAVDTELELKSAENILTLSTTKQKDHAEQLPSRFTMVPHRWSCPDCNATGTVDGAECDRCDGDGQVGHVAIAKYTGQNIDTEDISLGAQTSLVALAQIDTGTGIAGAQWLTVAEEAGLTKSSHYRHRKQLVDAKVVKELPGKRFTIVVDEEAAAS